KEAEPIQSVIELVNEFETSGDFISIFITARSSAADVHKLTQEWIVKNTSFEIPLLYTNGIPKGDAIGSIFTDKMIREHEWFIIDDAPHEIMNYLNLKEKLDLKMSFYIPDWSYNRHIDFGQRVQL
ncbi:hypothetical protein D7X33_49810, partial [Butyricicoccus sp. 1XD8-22]